MNTRNRKPLENEPNNMGLFDLYTKAKKKIGDTVSSLGSTARGYANSLKDTLNAPAPKVLQNTIGRLPDARNVFTPAYDALSSINTRPLSSRASSPLGKLAGGIVETPYTFLTSVPKTYGQTMKEINSKSIFTPGGVKRTAGRVLESGLDTASMGLLGKGARLAKAGAKSVADSVVLRQAPKVGALIREGAKSGLKVGAGYGGAYGAAEALKEEKSAWDTAKDVTMGAGTGAIMGGALGGGLPAVGALAKAAKHDIALGQRAPKTETIPTHRTFEDVSRTTLYPAERNAGMKTFKPSLIPEQSFKESPVLGTTARQIGEALPRPGMSIEDVSKTLPLVPNKNTQRANAVNAEKNARAAEAVAKMPRGKVIDTKRIIPDEVFNTEAGSGVFDELSAAKAGERQWVKTPDEIGTMGHMIGIPSTFPRWVPEDLRRTKLFEEVKNALLDATLPKSKPARRLYDIVHNEIRSRSKLPLYDFEKYDARKATLPPVTPKPTPLPKTSARRGNDMESDPLASFTKSLDEIPTPWGERAPTGERKMNPVAEFEKITNRRPIVPEPKTIGQAFDTFVNTEGNKQVAMQNSHKKATASPDPFEVLPEGTSEIFRHEPVVENYDTWLRAIGIKKASERAKLSFTQAKQLIHDWRVKNQPEYAGKQAEIGRFQNFVGAFKNAATEGIRRGKAYLEKFGAMDPAQGEKIIRYLDQPGSAPDDVAPAVNALRNEQDTLFKEAQDAGLDVAYWKDYITHIWRETPQEVAKKIRAGLRKGIITMDDISSGRASLTETPFFGPANSRLLKTYEAGERIGLHKLHNNPAQILAHYVKQLEQAKVIIRSIAELKKSGAVVEGVQPGMQALSVQGAEGLSAAPELANKINNAFGNHEYTTIPGKILEGAAAVSRKMKDLLMSGGIPASTINSYGLGMTLKEIGTLSPTRAWNAVSSFVVANNPNASRRFFEENLGQIEKIRNNDLQISTMLDKGGFVDNGLVKSVFGDPRGKGFWGGAQAIWDSVVNEPTFGRYLPMSQIKFFNSVESALLKKGYPAKAAEWMAAKELREGMGLGSAAKEAAKSQVWKDWRETLFFAPTHRMNMIRVFGNAARSLTRNPFLPGNQSAAQFLAGGIAVYAMYDWVNYKNTGHHLYENPEGKKFEAFIDTGDGNYISVPFMPSVATMPRLGIDVGERLADGSLGEAGGRAWQGTGSLLSKPIADVAMNADYFDRPITNEFDDPSKQWADRAMYLGKQYTSHPYVKTAIDAANGKPTEQLAAQAVEAPIRFSSEGQLASRKFWDEYNDTKPVYEKFTRLSKNNPEEASGYFSENKDAINRFKELDSVRSMYSTLKESGSKEEFGNILKENGFAFKSNPESLLPPLINTASAGANDAAPRADQPERDENGNAVWRGQKIYNVGGKAYVPSIEGTKKTFASEEAAVSAIEKEDFEASDEPSRVFGNFIYRRNPDGTAATPERLEKYTLERNKKQMEMQKEDDDFEGWFENGTKRLELLTKMLDDPTLDELDKMNVEDDMNDLNRLRAKFLSYGGAFTKPKKGRKLEEKFRYPLIDKDMMKVQSLLSGGVSSNRKPMIARRPLSLIPVRLPKVRRYRRRRK